MAFFSTINVFFQTRPGLNSFGSRNLEGDPSDGTASADATDDGWD